jgi:hypothetical protein
MEPRPLVVLVTVLVCWALVVAIQLPLVLPG